MGLFKDYLNQTRRPEGLLGKLMLAGMNHGHARLADWGMSHLPAILPEQIVDLGCGGGRNAARLLQKYPDAHVTALDYSLQAVEKTKACNRKMIAAGRCEVLPGNVRDLPFPDQTFDLACAFETIYFWPGLADCFAQTARVLKPGGIFLICNESDGTDPTGRRFEKIIDGMKCCTVDEIETALKAAGFSRCSCHHHARRPWILILAQKQ